MPRYRFFLEKGDRLLEAEYPEELPDDTAARVLAETVARDLAKNAKPDAEACIIAMNENGDVVHKARLIDAK